MKLIPRFQFPFLQMNLQISTSAWMALLPWNITKTWSKMTHQSLSQKPWQIIDHCYHQQKWMSSIDNHIQSIVLRRYLNDQIALIGWRRKKCRNLSPYHKSPSSTKGTIPCTKGDPNPEFLKRYNFGTESHPASLLNSWLPLTPRDNLESNEAVDVKGAKTTKFSVFNWTSNTNTKTNCSTQGNWAMFLLGDGLILQMMKSITSFAYFLWMVSSCPNKFWGSFGVKSKTSLKAMILFITTVDVMLPEDSKCSANSLDLKTNFK